jgi:L-alanine-DL-glutamate epimerase-like enolase superfamily enzyme
MHRRRFVKALAISSLAASATWSQSAVADDLKAHRVVRMSGFKLVCKRPKFVGKNSHLDNHGDTTTDFVVRIATSEGVEGVGEGFLKESDARQIVGKTLAELWTDGMGSTGALGRADHALFDLVSKIRGVPAWKLIGDAGPREVPIYDGSIYFNDLLPDYHSDPVGMLVKEAEQGLDRGFRAFKIKVGRGYKWMPKDTGFRRDIEVVHAIRQAVGPDVRLMVDANNGFDLSETKHWLDAAGDANLFFVEEMFPEQLDDDRALRAYIDQKGWKTLVADGESAREVDHFDEFLRAGVIDVVQPDIRAFGLSRQWMMSRRISELNPKARLAPHNWGSFLGQYMQLTLARAIPNFLMAEVDTSATDLFETSAFVRRDGKVTVPDTPGNGLSLREDVYQKEFAKQAWTVEA